MSEPDHFLACTNLRFGYKQGRVVFDRLTISFEAGSFIQIRGASGSGKSTLLRLLSRLEEPDAGAILFHGRPVADYPPPVFRKSICYVQQTPTLIAGTVRDNLLLPFGFRTNRESPKPDDDALQKLLLEFRMDDVALSDHALSLSGGQRQRLCLIRALLLNPDALLLDEPVSALDDESKQSVQEAILTVHRTRGITVLLASHQPFDTQGTPIVSYNITERALVRRNGS
ncbi:MAG: ATP-binding cassette domain-containing protein [Desulfobacteraceae bacterium]|nr:ATP-binding cassette domain-containing protein [Desulfobacteraceae bacterium]